MSSRRSRSGGTVSRDDVEPVVEVLAEATLADRARARSWLVAATRRMSTLQRPPAEPLDLALLQHAQELDLHVARDLADLVEEQGPAVGRARSDRRGARRRR